MVETYTAYYRSPIGFLKVSGTENFISEISFVDSSTVPDDRTEMKMPLVIINCIEELIQYFHGGRRVFEFPMDQTGTEFQQKVWNELLRIPFGKTISYLELSKRLGDPKVIRAAASANGKNNIAIAVPCHRVIGSKSDLVGYAGGLKRKKWLLEHEAKVAYGVQTLF